MARATFLMMPEPGHLVPTLPLASHLRAAGHDVCYVTVPHLGGWLSGLGFECQVLETAPEGQPSAPWSLASSGRAIMTAVERRLRSGGLSFPQAAIEELALADAVVCDVVFARAFGRPIASTLGCPVVSLCTSLPERGVAHEPEVVLCPIELEIPGRGPASAGRLYGEPSIWRERPSGTHVQPPDAAVRLAYGTLGTQSSNYADARRVLRAVVDAFATLEDWRLVLAAGFLAPEFPPETLPSNVAVVPEAAQLELLGRADLVITHGGLGTLKEAIAARVPAVVIPFLYDQPANARRVEYHGIGRACPPGACSAQAVRDIVRELSDDAGARARLAALSEAFLARERERPAARLIEDLMADSDARRRRSWRAPVPQPRTSPAPPVRSDAGGG